MSRRVHECGLQLICASADCRLQLKLFLLSGPLMFPSPTPLTLLRLSSLLHNNTKVFTQDPNCDCYLSLPLSIQLFHKPKKNLTISQASFVSVKFSWMMLVPSECLNWGQSLRSDCIDWFSLGNQADKDSTKGAGELLFAPLCEVFSLFSVTWRTKMLALSHY